MKYFKTKIGLIIAVLTIGLFAVALAQSGNGNSYGGYMMGPGMMGYSNHMMGSGMMGYGMGYHGHMMDNGYHGYANLSSEDVAKLEELQTKFYNETEDLRNAIEAKQLALNQELEKTSPDKGTAANLQKDLSKLESELDQKVLEHRLELKKVFPDTDVAMGYGYGHGEYCWR